MSERISQEEFKERVKQYTKDTVDVISEYKGKRFNIALKCKTCGYVWECSASTFMPSNMKKHEFTGCPECKYEVVECNYCHKKFRRLKSRLEKDNKTGFIYCSKECGNRHKNEFSFNKENGSNYRRNAFLNYPHKCDICGWDEDERVLEVHHIDENHGNNHIDNLRILCPTCHKKLSLHLYTYNELKSQYLK